MAPVPTAAPTLPPCHKNGPGGQKRRKYGAILVVAEHHSAGAAVHRNLRGVATMSEATLPAPLYLKSARFDRMFVLGIPLLALATGALALGFPGYFFLILSFDLAFLGYHHVVSTYTRLLFDLKSARQHWLLLIPLPLAVFGAVYLLALYAGVAAIATVYLHWQWYHYTRQSEGINKAYGMKTRSAQAGNTFLSMAVWKLPVPQWLATDVLAGAGACLLWWLQAQLRAWRAGTLGTLHFAYLCSHYLIYLVSYVAISDIITGWLVINVWHNAQYIAFVWLFNANQHKGGLDRQRLAISWLSQERNWPIYLLACLTLTTILYRALEMSSGYLSGNAVVPMVIIAYQGLNFHHYIVDSLIWKLRKRSVQAALTLP